MATRPKDTINILALCAGIGGNELGLRLALGERVRTICYVERDAYPASVLVARMADQALDSAPIWDDLRTFRGRPWRGVVDIITASYPCQGFSHAGKRQGASDPRHLWPDVLRVVREVRPTLVFCENAPGHLSLGLDSVLSDLGRSGYTVAADVFSAWEIGASHERERVFFLAADKRAVAHGHSAGRSGIRSRWIQHSQRPSQRNDTDGRRGTAVGNPNGERLEGRRVRRGQRDDERSPGQRGSGGPNGRRKPQNATQGFLCPHPPLRGDPTWSAIIRSRADLEPSLRRVAHELPAQLDEPMRFRADRLRCLGNAVDPLVAAEAFLALSGRLHSHFRECS